MRRACHCAIFRTGRRRLREVTRGGARGRDRSFWHLDPHSLSHVTLSAEACPTLPRTDPNSRGGFGTQVLNHNLILSRKSNPGCDDSLPHRPRAHCQSVSWHLEPPSGLCESGQRSQPSGAGCGGPLEPQPLTGWGLCSGVAEAEAGFQQWCPSLSARPPFPSPIPCSTPGPQPLCSPPGLGQSGCGRYGLTQASTGTPVFRGCMWCQQITESPGPAPPRMEHANSPAVSGVHGLAWLTPKCGQSPSAAGGGCVELSREIAAESLLSRPVPS